MTYPGTPSPTPPEIYILPWGHAPPLATARGVPVPCTPDRRKLVSFPLKVPLKVPLKAPRAPPPRPTGKCPRPSRRRPHPQAPTGEFFSRHVAAVPGRCACAPVKAPVKDPPAHPSPPRLTPPRRRPPPAQPESTQPTGWTTLPWRRDAPVASPSDPRAGWRGPGPGTRASTTPRAARCGAQWAPRHTHAGTESPSNSAPPCPHPVVPSVRPPRHARASRPGPGPSGPILPLYILTDPFLVPNSESPVKVDRKFSKIAV
jgi:hypothetical protein